MARTALGYRPLGMSLKATFLSRRTSCGRPSTRSAMMFFRISSVPPPMRMPGALIRVAWNLDCNGASPPSAIGHPAGALGVLDPKVGEIALVEARGARHLVDRPHVDGRVLHVHPEHGHALVLGHGRVGPGDQDAEVGVLRAGCPHLLAVD